MKTLTTLLIMTTATTVNAMTPEQAAANWTGDETAEVKAIAVDARDRADRNLQRIAVNTDSIGNVEEYAGVNRDLIERNAQQVSVNTAEIGAVKTGLNDLRGDFEAMAKDYREFKGQTNSAIAGLSAMTQLSAPTADQTFNVSTAIGGYEGEHSVAVGVGYRATDNLTFRASAAINEKASSTYGASASYGW